MNRITELAGRLDKAEKRVDALRAELHEEIRRAAREGATLASIAQLAGISRGRVHQILRGE